jgi:hypothetical protein
VGRGPKHRRGDLAEPGVARVPRRLRAARCNIRTAFDIQLVVITAAEEPANWPQLQSELAALSSNSVHKVVAGTSDASLLFTERDAEQRSHRRGAVVRTNRSTVVPMRFTTTTTTTADRAEFSQLPDQRR